MNNLVWIQYSHSVLKPQLYLVSKHFHHPQRKLYPSSLAPWLYRPVVLLATTNLQSVFTRFTFYGHFYAIYKLLCLASFRWHGIIQVIHVIARISTSLLFMTEQSMVYRQYSLFIHSPADGVPLFFHQTVDLSISSMSAQNRTCHIVSVQYMFTPSVTEGMINTSS